MADVLSELVVKITTDAKGLKTGLSSAEKDTEESSKRMSESIQKVGIAMAAAGAVITAAFGLMVKSAMEVESTRAAFESLAKSNGQAASDILDALQKASAGTITNSDLMLAANRAMVLGVAKNSDQFTSLMEIARDRAKTMGISVTQAFNDIVTGIGRGSPLILDNLGLVINATEANEIYAKTIGKSVSDLSEAEKQQALLNAVLEQGQKSLDKTSQATMTASEQFQAAKASVTNLTDQIGTYLLPVTQDILLAIQPLIDNMITWAKENPELAKTLTLIAAALGVFLGVVGTAIFLIPKLKAAWISLQLIFTASPWGAIIAGIGLLIAAGILLWQNWDKVSGFFVDAWSNMKIMVLNAIDSMLGYLEKFVGWIPFFSGKITEAREAISNMVQAEKVSSDLRDIQKALADTNEIIEEHTETIGLDTKALEDNSKALEEQKKARLELIDKINKTRQEYEYERSAAGRLRITLQDVIFALFDMGKTSEEVTFKLEGLGSESDNVNSVLEAFNLTAQDVNDILNKQTVAIDATTDAYKEQANAIKTAAEAQANAARAAGYTGSGAGFGTGNIMAGMSPYQVAYHLGYDFDNLTPSQYAEISRITGIANFDRGGIVSGAIGQPQLALVHGGETVIPANESMGGVTINFTEPMFFDREDTMNRFVEKIRKGIQRQDRIRFGSAYNG
uniref:Putative tail tape measure protein n=2 Tax=viral metagenome TaxID=1070528 RepID=A0A6M3L041_9ZZZZ